MNKSELKKMIAVIVRSEVKQQLPHIVAELYFNKQQLPQETELTFEESFDMELAARREEIPEPMINSDEGIYQKGGAIRRKNEDVVKRLVNDNPDMAYLYEGVSALPHASASPIDSHNSLAALGLNNDSFKAHLPAKTQTPTKSQASSYEEQRLKLYRESLDKKV